MHATQNRGETPYLLQLGAQPRVAGERRLDLEALFLGKQSVDILLESILEVTHR